MNNYQLFKREIENYERLRGFTEGSCRDLVDYDGVRQRCLEKYSKFVKCNLEGTPHIQVGNFVCYYDQEYLTKLISVKKSDPLMRKFLCEIGEIEYKDEFNTMKQGEFLPLIQNSLVVNPYTYLQILRKNIKKTFVIKETRSLKARLTKTKRNGRSDTHELSKWYKSQSLIHQAEKDGLINLTPLILRWGKSPKELKEMFGKSIWRQLSKKSFSFNQKFIDVCPSNTDSKYIKFLVQLPTKYLGCGSTTVEFFELIINIINHKRRLRVLSKFTKSDFRHLLSTAVDTYQMISYFKDNRPNLKIPNFNPKWSESKMQEIHDYLVTLKIEASKEIYPWIKELHLEHLTYKDSGYIFRLLSSPYELKIEGETMNHCVGHYDDRVAKVKYLVISMENQSENVRATIGCNIVTPLKVADSRPYTSLPIMEEGDVTKASLELDQVRGKYNQTIPDKHYPMINHFTELLTKCLNKSQCTRYVFNQYGHKLKNHY